MKPTRPTGSTHAGPPTGRPARSSILARRADWQVVWFKRDLRIGDHAPLIEALQQGPVIGLYLYEPELLESPEWDASHSRFIAEALRELESEWTRRGGCLLLRRGETVEQLERLHRETGFVRLWSHEETGNRLTFDRDLRVARWCRDRGSTGRSDVRTGSSGGCDPAMAGPSAGPGACRAASSHPRRCSDPGDRLAWSPTEFWVRSNWAWVR